MLTGKKVLGNVKVLDIIDLVPTLFSYGQSFEVGFVKQGDYTQHLLIVLVITHHATIGIEERHIDLLAELPAELIDIHRLIVSINLIVVECLLWHEINDVVVTVDTHHRAVHPSLILCHKCQIRIWIGKNHLKHPVVKNQVTFNEQGVIFLQLLLYNRQRVNIVGLVVDRILGKFNFEFIIIAMTDIINKLLALISNNNHHSVEIE